MDESLEKEPTAAGIEELTILLEDRTFVDYFNIFLCLPVFGQHVFYNFLETEFEFEPPVRNRRHLYLDRRGVLKWLYQGRLVHFNKSALYTEYILVKLLLDTKFELTGLDPENTSTFTKNVIGTATGMTLFRESMRGTCGENVFRCWKDLEAWKNIEDPVKKMYWKHVIKTQYINEGSSAEVHGNLKVKALYGIFKFDIVPDNNIQQQIIESLLGVTSHSMVESDDAMQQLQTILLNALRIYWLPRHLLHVLNVVDKEVLEILIRPAPGDVEAVDNVRRLRCRYKFPTIYQDSRITSPSSAIMVSKSGGDYSQMSLSSLFEDEQKKRKIDPVDFLSLCGGPAKKIQTFSTSPTIVGTNSPFLPEINSPENGSGDRKMSSANSIINDTHVKSQIPIFLSSYLGGKKRTLLGNLPPTSNLMVWCLASDILACCPFLTYLQQNEQEQHVQYLGFWTDIRNYLDTDENVHDEYGQPVKEQMVQRIIEMYLSEDGVGCNMFPKNLKKSLIQSLTTCDNVSVLCTAQEIVQNYLSEPLKLYIQNDRHQFLQQIHGVRKQLSNKHQSKTNQMSRSTRNAVNADPMILFNCATIDTESELSSPFSPFSPTTPCSSVMSHPPSTYHVSISEEQTWKAMEIAVLCSEYGATYLNIYMLVNDIIRVNKVYIAVFKLLVHHCYELVLAQEMEIFCVRKTSKWFKKFGATYLNIYMLVNDIIRVNKVYIAVFKLLVHHCYELVLAQEMEIFCVRKTSKWFKKFGVSMMIPEIDLKPSKLVDVLLSDYGSLHVTRDPSFRHEWLRSLREKPKINIDTIKVSRKIMLENVDISTLQRDIDAIPGQAIGRGRMFRRTGLSLDRPVKPKSLMEVLSTPVQYEFFKRFMLVQKMSLPVVFWRAVEDLQAISNGKTRQIKVTQILRKFFGKYTKYGNGLDCDEEIIRQIPNMEKVTPGILICAQAAVFRSLERKWYPMYCTTFPPESEKSSKSSTGNFYGMMKSFGETAQVVTNAKKVRKQRLADSAKAMALWLSFSKGLVYFVKALANKNEAQLFDMFLKYEVEKEKQSTKRELTSQLAPIEKNIMMSALHSNVQTRVVVRNRLVIMNRLPSDLSFWIEVIKYQSLVDSAFQKSVVSQRDSEFLTDKARSIISCFLASEILPRVQVNIPNDMALNIINSLASVGPKRGLFHDAVVLLFPSLYHFYRRFTNEWMKGNIPDEFFDCIEHVLRGNVGNTPHKSTNMADFTSLTLDQLKVIYQSQDEMMKIHFSIADGASITYSQDKKSPRGGTGTRLTTKYSVDVLKPDSSLIKNSKGGRGDRKESKHSNKAGDKRRRLRSSGSVKEKQKSDKIVVKVADQDADNSLKDKNGSPDRAKKLSVLIELLNKEKDAKIKEQNQNFSKVLAFSQVVSAAVARTSDMSVPESSYQSPNTSQ